MIKSVDFIGFLNLYWVNYRKKSASDAKKWIVGDLNALLKDADVDICDIDVASFCDVLDRCSRKELSTKMVKDILPRLVAGESSEDAIKALGGGQISNEDELIAMVDNVMAQHPDIVEKIKEGNVAPANFLMGQVMKVSQAVQNPERVRELILNACQS